jgi:hypothetical protein
LFIRSNFIRFVGALGPTVVESFARELPPAATTRATKSWQFTASTKAQLFYNTLRLDPSEAVKMQMTLRYSQVDSGGPLHILHPRESCACRVMPCFGKSLEPAICSGSACCPGSSTSSVPRCRMQNQAISARAKGTVHIAQQFQNYLQGQGQRIRHD